MAAMAKFLAEIRGIQMETGIVKQNPCSARKNRI